MLLGVQGLFFIALKENLSGVYLAKNSPASGSGFEMFSKGQGKSDTCGTTGSDYFRKSTDKMLRYSSGIFKQTPQPLDWIANVFGSDEKEHLMKNLQCKIYTPVFPTVHFSV